MESSITLSLRERTPKSNEMGHMKDFYVIPNDKKPKYEVRNRLNVTRLTVDQFRMDEALPWIKYLSKLLNDIYARIFTPQTLIHMLQLSFSHIPPMDQYSRHAIEEIIDQIKQNGIHIPIATKIKFLYRDYYRLLQLCSKKEEKSSDGVLKRKGEKEKENAKDKGKDNVYGSGHSHRNGKQHIESEKRSYKTSAKRKETKEKGKGKTQGKGKGKAKGKAKGKGKVKPTQKKTSTVKKKNTKRGKNVNASSISNRRV